MPAKADSIVVAFLTILSVTENPFRLTPAVSDTIIGEMPFNVLMYKTSHLISTVVAMEV